MQRNLERAMPLLASLVLLTGCAKTVVVTADSLCESWRHQTVSKNDKLTDETAAIAEGNNLSRVHWGCEFGKNRAKQ